MCVCVVVASPEYYDEVYFDSDSSEEEEKEADEGEGPDDGAGSKDDKAACSRTVKKVRKLTNDELFYDPDMDEEDERWIRRQRMSYHNGEFQWDVL